LISTTVAVQARRAARPARATTGRARCAWLGIAIAAVGAAIVGVQGPATLPWAVVCTALFAAGWWFLAAPSKSDGAKGHEIGGGDHTHTRKSRGVAQWCATPRLVSSSQADGLPKSWVQYATCPWL